ncbi:MAG TPA: threonine-phosphate decarboxylase [Terriglobia bacterium]|nr:threonine-phosphate decarboxylase [Terriglobia bacterium]
MASVTHGGRALMFAREHKMDYREVLDFSANINPLGPSTKALEAIRNALDLVRVYPDEKSVRLVRCLSSRLGVGVDAILPGNGATDLLYFWVRTIRPRTATLIIPTFTEYRRALEIAGAAIQTVQLHAGNHFRLPAITTNTDVVILTNPNNPSGSYAPPEEMLDWMGQLNPSMQIFIDEAFVEFSAQRSLVHYVERFPNLWVLRSMTKFYSLPGLRLGYLVGSGVPNLLETREPWQVNTIAELAGIVSLEDRSYEEATMQLIQRERIWLWKQLQTVPAIRVFPTNANFFLARCEQEETLDRLMRTLTEDKILIRDCRDVEGLDGPYFRFAIKTRLENERLLGHLRKL